MTERQYTHLTTACMIVGALAALCFPYAGRAQVAAGVLGILAGVVAAGTYLWYHGWQDGKRLGEGLPDEPAKPASQCETPIATANTPAALPHLPQEEAAQS